jgi:hypothetical protein
MEPRGSQAADWSRLQPIPILGLCRFRTSPAGAVDRRYRPPSARLPPPFLSRSRVLIRNAVAWIEMVGRPDSAVNLVSDTIDHHDDMPIVVREATDRPVEVRKPDERRRGKCH